jgi:hypothetical protein
VALERIIEASLELPGYSTLDEMATTIRAEVNEAIFAGITARMDPEGRLRAQGLLATAASGGRPMFNRLKKPAKRATWSRFRAQVEYLDEVDEIGDTAYWLEGVAPSKVTDFAGEAAARDIDTLSRYGDAKRLALVACLAHAARMRARDDLAEMLCKRVSSIVKKAKTAGKLELVATSSDASVLTALEHARAWHSARRDHIPLPPPAGGAGDGSGIAFASGNWRRAVTDRRHPGMVVRRHFEAMVFTCLAEELRTGDIAVTGAGEYADWGANLMPWEECEPLLEAFCAGVGLPATAAGFTARLRYAHLDAAGALDAGYEDNADLVIGEDGTPSVKRRRNAGTPKAAERLAEALERRMPERSLLSITARTAC